MTQDDFVTQILAAEETAKAEVEKTQKKAQNSLSQYKEKLTKGRAVLLEKSRDKFKEKLKDRQGEAKTKYQATVQDGARKASQLEKEMEGKMEKHLSTAQAYFVNELLT